jgi:hypothetical protein
MKGLKKLYPERKVFSRDAWSTTHYDADPNGGYYINSEVHFLASDQNDWPNQMKLLLL